MKPRRPRLAIAAVICALPCAAQALWTLWLCFFTTRTHTVSEDLMALGLYALWLCPLALVSLLMAILARGWRVVSVSLASIFFLGWLAVIVGENVRYKPRTIIGAGQANKALAVEGGIASSPYVERSRLAPTEPQRWAAEYFSRTPV